ncbi:MAG: LptE family protein [Deltaproteobacteria bacterium]|nr:LptE family protein [Deltaproteobacteria bacterium]
MPGGIESVSIPIFTNSTAKPDIESTVTQAFVNEFVNTLHVTTTNEVVMRGAITSYELTPVSYTQNDVNQEYRLTVTLSLMIVKGDQTLWEDSEISDYEDFTVIISDVTATNEAELAALKKIAEDTARFTKERMLEQF